MSDTPWTEDRVAALKERLDGTLTARQIAVILGGGLTNRAVTAKLRRMKLTGLAPHNVPSKTPRKRIRKPARIAIPELPKREAIEPLRVSLLALERGMCKWPVGGNDEQTFCGLNWRDDCGPYCAQHSAVAYIETKHRVREPREPRAQSRSLDWMEAA